MINTRTKKELRSKDDSALIKALSQCRRDLLNFRFQQANNAMQSTHNIRLNRRKVAVIKTMLNESKAPGVARGREASRDVVKGKKWEN